MRSPLGSVAGLVNRGVLGAVDVVLRSELVGEVVDRVVASPVAERVLRRALDGPLVEEIAQDVVRYSVVERVIDTRLLDQTVDRLLESDELWRLVDEVARSPAVTEAIAKQGVGFADQVAWSVRARSMDADAWLERAARRALRRKPGSG